MLKRSLFVFVFSASPFKSAWVLRLALAGLMLISLCNTSFAQTANTSSKPQLVPNARRYKESGLKPATGRSGSASVTARALLGKDGTTTVEMSTGQLDSSGTTPGNINRSQLKPLDENGDALYTRNYPGLSGGYFNTTVNDLHRGQQVQMQATVTGIDANRTNVVTVVETVKVRPDLSPSDLSAPAKGAPGSPVNISVVVKELRGDSGASANLVLYVDGTAVDRANNVWVDARGTVSCVFTHTFSSAGTKELEVKVEGTTPGDYDTSNNSVAGTMVIGQVSAELNYNFQVVDVDDNYRAHVYEKQYFNGVLQSEREEDIDAQGWHQNISFHGWTRRMISFPINISHQETNDGAVVFSNSYSNLTPTSVIDATDATTRFIAYNVWRYDPTTGYFFNLSTTANINLATGARTEMTSFSSNRQAGDVTFYSAGYERFWDGYTGEEFFYTWNTTDVSRAGTRFLLGTQYGISISLTAGDGASYTAAPEVTLRSFDNSGQQPNTCFDWSFDEFSGTSCITYNRIQFGKHGFAFKDANP
ncbi:MAG TPA: hypothetical protein VF074_04475 [Pyrinomonadaceae bacterium]